MDLARMTYNNAAELNSYLERSGGVILECFAYNMDREARDRARQLGTLIRRVETIRDLVAEARAGRVYWPLDELDAKQVSVTDLKSNQPSKAACTLLATETAQLRDKFAALVATETQATFRPLTVLAELHVRLLRRIDQAKHDVFTQRHELGPLEKVWFAWRTARRT
jgi:phytoene synthase